MNRMLIVDNIKFAIGEGAKNRQINLYTVEFYKENSDKDKDCERLRN